MQRAFSLESADGNRVESKIYIRFTGKLTEAWAVDAIKKSNPRFEIKNMKAEDGTSEDVVLRVGAGGLDTDRPLRLCRVPDAPGVWPAS